MGPLRVLETPGDPHYPSRTAVARLGKGAGFKVTERRRLGIAWLTELLAEV